MAAKNRNKAARRAWKKDNVYGENPGSDPDNLISEAGAAGIVEAGSTDAIGLPEIDLLAEAEMDDMERRELLVSPSDLLDIGDPEAGDVGVPGGLAAGGEMSEGGRGHTGSDPWGAELTATAMNYRETDGAGGRGSIEGEMAEMEDERLRETEEKY